MSGADAGGIEAARAGFRDLLVEHEYLVPMGLDGLYGRSGKFEEIAHGVEARIAEAGRAAHADRARVLRFPPVFPSESFEKTDYIASFPDLTGSVHTFRGGEAEHRALLADREQGHGWDSHLVPAGTALVSAACHPAYPGLTGVLPQESVLLDVHGYCFRHEPAVDPARMQVFRQQEFVVVGSAEHAARHRDSWVGRALEVLRGLGLEVAAVPANDPFFGRAGRMLAANQLSENLKTELVVRLYGPDQPATAITSCNYHQDHFGVNFSIQTPDGAPAHSACVGFGIERIVLALLRANGVDRATWPSEAKAWL